MTNRTQQLKQLMADHDLSPSQVADLLNRKTMTVRIWCCNPGSRVIPQHSLELLRAMVEK